MIELIVSARCTGCNACVTVCPTNVFEPRSAGPPLVARPDACQTCFMCELYCPADALYVGPDCEHPEPVDEQAIGETDWPQQYRRDSGWGKNRRDHPNETWFMQQMLGEIRAIRAGLNPADPADSGD
jgi:NAD-dependent dihydropyrimidine dehydrogenase PreA subunit